MAGSAQPLIDPSCLTLDSPCWQTEFQSFDYACPPFESATWPVCLESWIQPDLCSKMPCAAPVNVYLPRFGLTLISAKWKITGTFLPDLLVPSAPMRVTMTGTASFTGLLGNAPVTFACTMMVSSSMYASIDEIIDPYQGNVILLLHFDGNYNDSSQERFIPSLRGTPTVDQTGKFGKGLTVRGTGSDLVLYVPDAAPPTMNSSYFPGMMTMEGWVKPADFRSAQMFGHVAGTTLTAYAAHVYSLPDGKVRFLVVTEQSGGGWWFDSVDTLLLNQWQHVAATRDAAWNCHLFIRGVLQPGTVNLQNMTFIGDNQRIGIGGFTNSGNVFAASLFNGMIDEVRFTRDVCRYTTSFPEPLYPFPPDPMRFRPVTMNMSASFMVWTDTGADDQLDKVSLLLHMDGVANSTAFYDNSPAYRPMQIIPAATGPKHLTGQKKFGPTSGYFDGAGNCIYPVADDPMLNLTTGDFTVEFWMLPSDANEYGRWLFNRHSTVSGGFGTGQNYSDSQYGFFIDSTVGTNTSRLLGWVTTSAGVVQFIAADTSWHGAGWHHIAMTRRGDLFNLWVDGVDRGNITLAGVVLKDNVPMNTYVGCQSEYNGYAGGCWWGYLDEVRVTKGYCRYTGPFTPSRVAFPTAPALFACTMQMNASMTVLSASEDPYFGMVQLLLHGDQWIDHSASRAPVTVSGAVSIAATPAGFMGQGTFSTATGGWVSVPDDPRFSLGTQDFTLEYRFYWPGSGNPANGLYMLGQLGAAGGSTSCGVGTSITTLSKLYVLACAGTTSYEIYSTTTVTHNAWHSAAVARVGAMLYLFLDGNLEGSLNIGAASAINDSPSAWTIFRFGDYPNNGFINGQIEEVRLTVGKGRYNANYTPATVPFPDAAPVDPYYDSVTLHLRGTSYAGFAPDLSPAGRVMAASGNAGMASDFVKYGPNALTFDGAGDYFSDTAANAIHGFSGVDVTMEGWHYITGYPNNDTGAYEEMIFSTYSSAQSTGWQYGFIGTATSITGISIYDGATGYTFNYSFALNTYYHVAMSKQGGNVRVFVDGVQIGITRVMNGPWAGGTNPLQVGWLNYLASGYPKYYKGRMNELRITRGLARYTANFTPPTMAFPADKVSDPLLSKVALLLHGNAANAVTQFVDHSPAQCQLLRTGTVVIDTSVSKFGGSSIYNANNTGYLYTPDHARFTLGAQEFCIEGWLYRLNDGSGMSVYYAGHASVGGATATWILETDATGKLNLRLFGPPGNTNQITDTAVWPATTWEHIAIERVGNTLMLLRGGAVRGTLALTPGLVFNDATGAVALFSAGDITGSRWGTGRFDDFRMTVGAYRYGGAYPVPAMPFPNA